MERAIHPDEHKSAMQQGNIFADAGHGVVDAPHASRNIWTIKIFEITSATRSPTTKAPTARPPRTLQQWAKDFHINATIQTAQTSIAAVTRPKTTASVPPGGKANFEGSAARVLSDSSKRSE